MDLYAVFFVARTLVFFKSVNKEITLPRSEVVVDVFTQPLYQNLSFSKQSLRRQRVGVLSFVKLLPASRVVSKGM